MTVNEFCLFANVHAYCLLIPFIARHSCGPQFCSFHHGRLAAPFGFIGELAQPAVVRIRCVPREPEILEQPVLELRVRQSGPDAPPFFVVSHSHPSFREDCHVLGLPPLADRLHFLGVEHYFRGAFWASA